ncbi:MAG TPA: SCO family protein [Cytophagaceae bacterium]|jgi:protein SCO1/2
MNSKVKIGLLIVLLVIPILTFLFLKIFGSNHYTLPVYFAEDSVQVNGKYKVTKAHRVPNFNLVDQDGRQASMTPLRGSILITDFFFTRCEGICPKMSTQLTRVQEAFKNDKDVKIISFSVDPSNDNPKVLKQYASLFNADSTCWTFITGNKDSIYYLAQKGFFLTAMEDRERPLEFIHSEKLVLVDKQGWIRGYYNGTDKEEVDRMITEIKVLQQIYADR